jgi:hypothetical protein
MRTATRLLLFALAGICLSAGCVSGSGPRDGQERPAGSADAFYAEVSQSQERMANEPDPARRFALMHEFRTWLREQTSGYERALVDGAGDPTAQTLYDDMMSLQVTLNNIPARPFSPDYCDIVRNSIYVTWAPESANPGPDMFPRPVREGLRFLDLLCTAPAG